MVVVSNGDVDIPAGGGAVATGAGTLTLGSGIATEPDAGATATVTGRLVWRGQHPVATRPPAGAPRPQGCSARAARVAAAP